jgi:hypothetical protein
VLGKCNPLALRPRRARVSTRTSPRSIAAGSSTRRLGGGIAGLSFHHVLTKEVAYGIY